MSDTASYTTTPIPLAKKVRRPSSQRSQDVIVTMMDPAIHHNAMFDHSSGRVHLLRPGIEKHMNVSIKIQKISKYS
ncbi:hypothetical protein BSLG_005998 [Batrachochytrium salamandrivorans]|nr:hypothetical protein BSLG_005998 [Batrachochytrium salamandrivorans]